MTRAHCLDGRRFGRWLVVGRAGSNKQRQSAWECRCDCGAESVVSSAKLVRGVSTSCGCFAAECSSRRLRTHGHTISRRVTPEYRSWVGMIRRCTERSCAQWENYGGRGIRVCARWLSSFENFLADMGRRPSPVHSLDRRKVNENYEPNNCKWSTPEEQANNRRNNRWVVIRGEILTFAQAARKYSVVGLNTARRRYRHSGWSADEAFFTPLCEKPSRLAAGNFS